MAKRRILFVFAATAAALAFMASLLLAAQPYTPTPPTPTHCPDAIACHALKRRPTADK